jgi:hypothetical protein
MRSSSGAKRHRTSSRRSVSLSRDSETEAVALSDGEWEECGRVYPAPQKLATVSRRTLLSYGALWCIVLVGPAVAVAAAAATFAHDAPDLLNLFAGNLALSAAFVLFEVVLVANAQGRCCDWRVRPTGRYHRTTEPDWSNRTFALGCIVLMVNMFVLLGGGGLSCKYGSAIGSCGDEWSEWHAQVGDAGPLPVTRCRCVPASQGGGDCASPLVVSCDSTDTRWTLLPLSHPADRTCRHAYLTVEPPAGAADAIALDLYCTSDPATANVTVYLLDGRGPCNETTQCGRLPSEAVVAHVACGAGTINNLVVPSTATLVVAASADGVRVTVDAAPCYAALPDESAVCTSLEDAVPPAPASGMTETMCNASLGLTDNAGCSAAANVSCAGLYVGWRGRDCLAVRADVQPVSAACSPTGRCLDGADGHGVDSVCAALHEEDARVAAPCTDVECARVGDMCVPGTPVGDTWRGECWTNVQCGSCGPLQACDGRGGCVIEADPVETALPPAPAPPQTDCTWNAKVACSAEPASTSVASCNSVPAALDDEGNLFHCAWSPGQVMDGVPPGAFDTAWWGFGLAHLILGIAMLFFVHLETVNNALGLVYKEDIEEYYSK